MELGVIDLRLRAHLSDVRGPLAIICEPCGRRERFSITRLVELARRQQIHGFPLRLYPGAGRCFSLRTTDGELPVQRTKAWLNEVDPS